VGLFVSVDLAKAPAPRVRGVDRTTRDVALWTAFGLLAAALFANQYVTLPKLKAALLSRVRGMPVDALSTRIWSVEADWRAYMARADFAILAVLLVAAGYIVMAEVRRGAVTTLLRRAETSPRLLYALLGLTTLAITRAYLGAGQVFMGDAETHMLRGWMFAQHFRQLQTPVWSNAWYGGFPLLVNYSPLYFMATALFTIVFGDIHLATKLLLWGCHAGSVFLMFFFLRRATKQTLAALVGAVAYALPFHRLNIILYQGDLQVAALWLIFPGLLLIAERFLETRAAPRRTFVLLTLMLAVMILNHHGYAFFGLIFFAVHVTVRLALSEGSVRERVKLLAFFAAAEVGALCISAFLLVPFLFDQGEYRGMPNWAFVMLVPNLRAPLLFTRIFRWAATGDASTVYYMGLSVGALALLGSVYAIRRRIPAGVAVIACAVVSLLMVRTRAQYNVKNVDFFMVYLCALAAWGVMAIEEIAGRRARAIASTAPRDWHAARIATIALGVMLLDLGPTTFQSVFREHYEFKQPMYRQLVSVERRPYKILERQVAKYDPGQPPGAFFQPTRVSVPSAYAPTQTPLGFFHEGAGRSFGYHAEIVKRLQLDLNRGRVSELSVQGLYLLGVGDVLFRDQGQWFTPQLEPSPYFDVREGEFRLKHASPVVFSTRTIASSDLDGYPSDDLIREGHYYDEQTFDYAATYFRDLVEPILRRMAIDVDRGVADTLVARDDAPRLDLGSPADLRAEVESFSTDLKHVEVGYRANRDAVGLLAYTYFPYLDVRIDGRPVPFFRSAFDDILLRLPSGRHAVTVTGVAPPLQRRMLWFSLAALLAVLLAPTRLFSAV
jgi:6-pyruvoyl-tetrahydropterin synthase related domain